MRISIPLVRKKIRISSRLSQLRGLRPLRVTALRYADKEMSEKIDKGFCLQYSKLSYRRKFIRTLWMIPGIGIMFLIPPSYVLFGMQRNLWIALAVLATIAQAVFTCKKWKEEER